MDYFYNKVYLAYKQGGGETASDIRVNDELTPRAVMWSTTGGEAANIEGRTMAVDGMNNVIEFLEMVESGKIDGVDFLEIRACDQSCSGGILSHRNRFLVQETLQQYADGLPPATPVTQKYIEYGAAKLHMEEVEPRSMVKYGRDITAALHMMEAARQLRKLLPDIDCGACGAPSCEALADDIVRDQADINSCIFLRTTYEKRGELSLEDEIAIMEGIWGKDRFSSKKSQ